MGPRAARYLLAAISVASVTQVALWIASGTPPPFLGLTLLVHAAVGFAYRRRVLAVIRDVEPRTHDLALLAALLGRVERESFQAPGLRALIARLEASGRRRRREAHRLSRLADLLASRQNQIFAPVPALLFSATQLAFAVEGWRAQRRRRRRRLARALSRVRSPGGAGDLRRRASRPPVPGDRRRRAAARRRRPRPPAAAGRRPSPTTCALGGGAPALLLVSGSNMSGKSTLLRTVGVNAVLALAGAPVRAARLRLTPLAVGATLRVQDSLQAGRSRFFAEITRLRADRRATGAARRRRCCSCSTSCLHGTNSHDRRHRRRGGAARAARTRRDRPGHDPRSRAHRRWPTRLGPRAANVHFEDQLRRRPAHVRLPLRPGVVQGSNAIALMRSVGLDV